MKLIHKEKLKDVINIDIITDSYDVYKLFISAIKTPELFYIEEDKIINVDVFYEDIVNIGSWTKEDHFLLEDALRIHKRDLYDTTKERWNEISKNIPGKTLRECIDHFKHIKGQLIEKNKKKESVIDIKNDIYKFCFNSMDTKKKIYLVDIILNSDNDIESNGIIIVYNIDILLFSYGLSSDDVYARLFNFITKYNLDINNIYFSTYNLETCFNLEDFAKYYLEQFKLDINEVKKRLWGDNYFSNNKGWITESNKLQRSFCQYVLNPIIQLEDAITNKKEKKIDKMLLTLNIKPENKYDFNNVINTWYPLNRKIIELLTFS
jgi:hypothetical protein